MALGSSSVPCGDGGPGNRFNLLNGDPSLLPVLRGALGTPKNSPLTLPEDSGGGNGAAPGTGNGTGTPSAFSEIDEFKSVLIEVIEAFVGIAI